MSPLARSLSATAIASLVVLLQTATAQISGVVYDESMAPVEGARVSVQATTEITTTDVNGVFDLPGATGTALVVVAAKKSYYNSSVVADEGTSGLVLTLPAVAQSSHPDYDFLAPTACMSCHPFQYSQWQGSPMANAGDNTWVYDIYDGTGTPGGMGGFVYTRDSRFAEDNPASECASCHQPEPWIQNPFNALDDFSDLSEGALHGISCEVCHKVADIEDDTYNYPGIWPETVTFTRPAPGEQVEYGVLGDTSFSIPNLMQPSYQPQMTALLCSTCHQDKNDPDEDGDFGEANGVISEPTYREWLLSPYGDPESPDYASCVDCHMPSYGATTVASISGVPTRDPETIRHHRIEGTTSEYLDNSVELETQCRVVGGELRVEVSIENTRVGHHVPTGVTIRNMILLVEAWREVDGAPLVHTGDQTVHDLGGIGDPAQGYYAGLPGKLYAKHNHDEHGNGPTFFTDATGILWDNRIPAKETDTTHYTFAIPNGTGFVQTRARLIYRRAFRGFVDAKAWTVDGHGNTLEDIEPPHYGHLMEETQCRTRVRRRRHEPAPQDKKG